MCHQVSARTLRQTSPTMDISGSSLLLLFGIFSVDCMLPGLLQIPSESSEYNLVRDFGLILSESDLCWGCYEKATIVRSPKTYEKAFPVVKNLNEILSQFSDQKCFIMSDNFVSVNILPHSHPVALRRLVLRRNCKPKRPRVWVPVGIITHCSMNRFAKTGGQFTTKLMQLQNSEDIPYRINRTVYTWLTKPWNCQIQIYLYPPNIRSNNVNPELVYFPYIFEFYWDHLRPASTNLPSDIFTINLIIYHSSQFQMRHYGSVTEVWPLNILVQHGFSINEIRAFLLANVIGQHSSVNRLDERISDPAARIESVDIIKNSGYWTTLLETIPLKTIGDLKSIKSIFNRAFSLEAYMTEWHVQQATTTFEYLQHELRFCNVNNFLRGTRSLVASDDLLGYEILHVWFSIFINFTYRVGGRWNPCLNSEGASDRNPTFRLKFFINLINLKFKLGNHMTMTKAVNLDVVRFMTSRTRGLEQIGFVELIGYFDWWVWALLSIAILIVGFMSYFIASFEATHLREIIKTRCSITIRLYPYWKHVAWTYQILVEQGGVHSEQSSKIPELRRTLGPFLLMSVVLIAAYKNDNLYNIALPRKPVLI